MKDRDIPLRRARDFSAIAPGVQPDREPSLARVCFGVYATAQDLVEPGWGMVYRTKIRAVAAVRKRPVFARESALALHGLPYGQDPGVVYTTGDVKTARKKAGVVHVARELDPVDVTCVDDLLVCALPFALADVARRRDVLVAVAAIDWALREQQVTKEDIVDALDRQPRRGRAAAQWAIAFADARAESVGESYSRVRINQLGFALPELQSEVTGRSGRRWRIDMRWLIDGRRPLYGEFDGMVKYGELANQAGQTGARVLAEEKAREDDIRFSGDMMRWTWGEMMSLRRFEQLLGKHGVPRAPRFTAVPAE